MARFTMEQVDEAVDTALLQRGEDFVYEIPDGGDCLYVHDRGTEAEQPGCLVGLIVLNLTGENVPSEMEGTTPKHSGIKPGAQEFWDGLFDSPTLDYLNTMQIQQDHGSTWGEAVSFARRGRKAEENA